MKKALLCLVAILSLTTRAQDINDRIRLALQAQSELDSSYADADHSPLTKEDLATFTGLPFFPVDTNWMVECQLILTPNEEPFEMPTTTRRKPLYRKFGDLVFDYHDSTYTLEVYQNLDLLNRPGLEDYLFLPFGDASNGISSYGGGRYLELRIPQGDSMTVDFNQCYNPYCAYNDRYSCPKIPLVNILPFEIKAGVRYIVHY